MSKDCQRCKRQGTTCVPTAIHQSVGVGDIAYLVGSGPLAGRREHGQRGRGVARLSRARHVHGHRHRQQWRQHAGGDDDGNDSERGFCGQPAFWRGPTDGDVHQHLAGLSGAATYLWRFGDETTSASANPTHTYTNTGQFTVSLQITDG